MAREASGGWKRRVVIALNGCETLPRDAVCRLARDLDHWARPKREPPAESSDPSGENSDPRLLHLPVARAALRDARVLAARAEQRAAALGARLVTVLDPGYPAPLHDLDLPPPVLYCLGDVPDRPATAIVGSRAADAYGREAATLFACRLAEAGLTIVSGLARGVDTAAHRGALAAAGGRTVAVLGCGLDVRYPTGADRLRRQIAERGAVITEFPPGTPPQRHNFPIRNRIIAALACGTLVVQGEARSGSLITARLALELGRDVYAVPGRIFDSRSAGPNGLIRDGALAAQRPRDILESLPQAELDRLPAAAERPVEAAGPRAAGADGDAGRLLAAMTPGEPLASASRSAASGLAVERLLSLLLELELAGRVRREPGPAWCRRA